MKKLLVAAFAVLTMLGALPLGTARAADMAVKAAAPMVSPEYNWSGFYVGANVGWIDSSYNWRYTNPAPVACCAPFNASISEATVGIHVGAQYQWNHIVIGIEGAVDGVGNNNWASSGSGGCIAGSTLACQIQPQAIETLGGRLGWGWNNWLLYGDAGAARGSVQTRTLTTAGTSFDVTNGSAHNGWYAGGGAEYMLAKGQFFDLIVGAEYQHIDLRTQNELASSDGFATSPPGVNGRAIGAKEDIVRVRVSVKGNPFH